jgi:hypothetical protein
VRVLLGAERRVIKTSAPGSTRTLETVREVRIKNALSSGTSDE